MRRWTDAERAELRRLVADGGSTRSIADALGRSASSVHLRLHREGILLRRDRPKRETIRIEVSLPARKMARLRATAKTLRTQPGLLAATMLAVMLSD